MCVLPFLSLGLRWNRSWNSLASKVTKSTEVKTRVLKMKLAILQVMA